MKTLSKTSNWIVTEEIQSLWQEVGLYSQLQTDRFQSKSYKLVTKFQRGKIFAPFWYQTRISGEKSTQYCFGISDAENVLLKDWLNDGYEKQ